VISLDALVAIPKIDRELSDIALLFAQFRCGSITLVEHEVSFGL
jgi:hypothetical protein